MCFDILSLWGFYDCWPWVLCLKRCMHLKLWLTLQGVEPGGVDGKSMREKDRTNVLLISDLPFFSWNFIGVWQLANANPSLSTLSCKGVASATIQNRLGHKICWCSSELSSPFLFSHKLHRLYLRSYFLTSREGQNYLAKLCRILVWRDYLLRPLPTLF